MGVTKQEGKNIYILKRLIDIGLAVILVGAAVFGVKSITKDFRGLERKSNNDSVISTSDKSKPDDAAIYVTEFTDNENINLGSLILVNNMFEYKGNEDDLVSVYDVREEKKSDCYTVLDKDVKVRKEAAEALDTMLKAFHDETGHSDIQVDSGYRSVKYQQEIYDASDDKEIVAEPGFSDYHTGYSVDLNVVDEDGNSLDFDGTGDFKWFAENCYKYGFIVRFPEDKTEQTGLDYRPWHFRYVGAPHAYYMKENNLCLEEYIQQLTSYNYNETHLEFENFDGKKYEIYYYPKDEGSSSTMLAVPSDKDYTVSGNNIDGFIVTSPLESSKDSSGDGSDSDTESKSGSKADDESSAAEEGGDDTAQSKKAEE
ncbi:M15 family metallopeptidase [Porcipelethomonas sp.]|uniref:M15 family metallopeptidase n=1 Tax=Porcipelethomonas sp. TaxID=2981675 RepID=UPI003EF102B8